MANPFPSKFNSECQNCQNHVDAGDVMYAHDGMFICSQCAVEGYLVCECGNYKKEHFKTCFACSGLNTVQVQASDENEWQSGSIIAQVRKKKKDEELPF